MALPFLWISQIESILYEIDFLGRPSGLNRYHIEPGILAHLVVGFEVIKGRHGYFSLLMGCYRQPGTAVKHGLPCLNLDKNNRFFMPPDNIDLTHRACVVPLQYFVTLLF